MKFGSLNISNSYIDNPIMGIRDRIIEEIVSVLTTEDNGLQPSNNQILDFLNVNAIKIQEIEDDVINYIHENNLTNNIDDIELTALIRETIYEHDLGNILLEILEEEEELY